MKAVTFIDGQNLYFRVAEAFRQYWPNYDVKELSTEICRQNGWELSQTHFYTGVPDHAEDPFWHGFWSAKKTAMLRQGVHVFTRPLRYLTKQLKLDRNIAFELPTGDILPVATQLFDWGGKEIPPGTHLKSRVGKEKGIDIRIALDVIALARAGAFDVAIIFSQDQDLSEAVHEVAALDKSQGRSIHLASAFPIETSNSRGIDKTQWLTFDQSTYDRCIDPRDYRPKKK